jgi:hypothetical protein
MAIHSWPSYSPRVHSDDVGMPQLGRQVGFSGEALPVILIAGQAGGQHLQCVTAR